MAHQIKKENYAQKLQNSFNAWNVYREQGGFDPSHADGVNMNLICTHIRYYKQCIKENMREEDFPVCYFWDTPENVSYDYMAQPELIREKAKELLVLYKQDTNYQYICTRVDFLKKEDAEKYNVHSTICNIKWLELAIQNDDLISMRTHTGSMCNWQEFPKHRFEDFAKCAIDIRSIPAEKMIKAVQGSLF